MNAPLRFPSFFDLREFARSVRPAPAETEGLARCQLELPAGPVAVGALHVAPGEHSEMVDGDEFVVVGEGRVSLRIDGTELSLVAGDSAVIRAGSDVRWSAGDAAMLVFMRYRAQPGQDAGFVPIDYAAELTPSGAPLA